MKTYLTRHLQVLLSTLGHILRSPISSLNTVAIIAITLLLPSLLYITVKSAESLSNDWQGRPQISVFLEANIEPQVAQLIFDELRLQPSIAAAEIILPDQALTEFRSLSGLDFEIDFLDENPLPTSIVIMPSDQHTGSQPLLALKQQLEKIDGIDQIRLDLEWTNRFSAILNTFTKIAGLLSTLLAIALILIVSNTIRLLILNRRAEIEITKLVGGTNSFVRRPFLYYGAIFGFLGACLTIILLLIAAFLIHEPVQKLSSFYQQSSLIHQLTAMEVAIVIGTGTLLGWLAARWSVAQHLRHIQPQ